MRCELEVGIRRDPITLGLAPEAQRIEVVALAREHLDERLACRLCALDWRRRVEERKSDAGDRRCRVHGDIDDELRDGLRRFGRGDIPCGMS